MFPEPLKKGDTIGIISPSSPLEDGLLDQFNLGIKKLQDYGFNIKLSKYYDNIGATGEQKAEDINTLFGDNAIKAIISTQGGNGTISILPYLDFDLIRKNPKICMGFSDVSILLNAISYKTGLITFLGPDVVWKFGSNFTRYDETEFIDNLISGGHRISSSDNDWDTIRRSNSKPFEGILWGGNIRCFLKLLGTNYRPDLKGGILLIEEANQSCIRFDSILEQLRQNGVFEIINGIVIGHNHNYGIGDLKKRPLRDIILEKTEGYDINILQIKEFGHKSLHSIFPIGMRVSVTPNSIKYMP